MKLPPIIGHNFEIKLVALVMSSLLWLYVIAGRDLAGKIQVPIVYANLAGGLRVADNSPAQLDVEFSGSRLALLLVRTESIRAVLDMTGVREGTVTFANLESSINGLNGIRVTRVNPGRIDLLVQKAP